MGSCPKWSSRVSSICPLENQFHECGYHSSLGCHASFLVNAIYYVCSISSKILPILLTPKGPNHNGKILPNCSAALLYSPQYCTDAYKFGYLYSLVVVITGTTHFRNLHHFTSGKQGAYITDTLSLFCELQ